jgi:hypothetical protein
MKALEQQNFKKVSKLQQSSFIKGVIKEKIVRNKIKMENMVSMKVEQKGFVTKEMVLTMWSPKKVWEWW